VVKGVRGEERVQGKHGEQGLARKGVDNSYQNDFTFKIRKKIQAIHL